MEALLYLEAHISAQTGYPDWLTQDPDSEGYWEASRVSDLALNALQMAQKADKSDTPGTLWRVAFNRESAEPQDPSE